MSVLSLRCSVLTVKSSIKGQTRRRRHVWTLRPAGSGTQTGMSAHFLMFGCFTCMRARTYKRHWTASTDNMSRRSGGFMESASVRWTGDRSHPLFFLPRAVQAPPLPFSSSVLPASSLQRRTLLTPRPSAGCVADYRSLFCAPASCASEDPVPHEGQHR